MDVIQKSSAWFLSEEGVNAFQALNTKEDRTIFLYSYLKAASQPSVKESKHLIKIAFFLEDAVAGSVLPYASFPALIDPQQNPFTAYITKIKQAPDAKDLLCVFLSILHGITDPLAHTDEMDSIPYSDKFYAENDLQLLNPDDFDLQNDLKETQLKILWLFGKEEH